MAILEVTEEEKKEAGFMASGYKVPEIKNRAYINALGAEVLLQYLSQNGIDTAAARNIHSVRSVLGELDIADVMLDNIHIDVRVIFDEECIFIPKEHFEYNIAPDVYVVFKTDEIAANMEFVGFFTPRAIEDEASDENYYFVKKDVLTSPAAFIPFLRSFTGATDSAMPEDELDYAQTSMISMIDNNVENADKKLLLAQLAKNAELRDKFIEFENFEMLASKAINFISQVSPAPAEMPVLEDVSSEDADLDMLLSDTTEAAELISGEVLIEEAELLAEPYVIVDEPGDDTLLDEIEQLTELESLEDNELFNDIEIAEDVLPLENLSSLEEPAAETLDVLPFAQPLVNEGFENADLIDLAVLPDLPILPVEDNTPVKDMLEALSETEPEEQIFDSSLLSEDLGEIRSDLPPLKPSDLLDELMETDLANLDIEPEVPDELSLLYNQAEAEAPEEQIMQRMQDIQPEISELVHEQKKTSVSKTKKVLFTAAAVTLAAASYNLGLNYNNADKSKSAQDDNLPPEGAVIEDMPSEAMPEETSIQAEPTVVADGAAMPASKTQEPSASALSVKKISWELPDSLSYSPKFKDYLVSVGKSLKLSLSSDLLLATEFAYNDTVRVDFVLDKGGISSATVAQSSGSAQIDNIVLRSVKSTFNVAKPPSDELRGSVIQLSIVVYI